MAFLRGGGGGAVKNHALMRCSKDHLEEIKVSRNFLI